MILTTYQEQESLHEGQRREGKIATVYRVNPSGIQLTFDGEKSPSRRLYAYNQTLNLNYGMRVFVLPYGDTYIVAFPI